MSTALPPAIASMLSSDRLVHALCLEGDADMAIEVARAVAGAVLCERQQGEMCGECLHCRKVAAGVHADLAIHSVDDGGYKKDAVRSLRAELYRSPHEGRAKVIVLRDAQLMSHEVQNLLLKVMEEPPEDSYFILTCDNRYRLLSTVLSRMVSVSLPQRSDDELVGELLASDIGKTAMTIVEAMTAGGYKLLATLQGCEKNRSDYTLALQAVERLLGFEQVCTGQGISLQKRLRWRAAVAQAVARNDSNGYLPTISAALAEQISRR